MDVHNLEVIGLIDELEDIVEAASGLPLSSKVMVDKGEVLEILTNIRILLPDEVKQASYINEEKERILVEAKRKADYIIEEAENKLESLVDEDGITKEANLRAEEIVEKAKENAREIRLGALDYTDMLLSRTQESLKEIVEMLEENKNELKND